MADIEKVISDLAQQIRWIEEIECHKFPGWLSVTNAMRDALKLLKEQEATPDIFDCGVKQWFTCGKCGETIHDHDKYCSQCGTKVSWK